MKIKEKIYNFLTLSLAIIFIVGGVALVKFYPVPEPTEKVEIYLFYGDAECGYYTKECFFLCIDAVDSFVECKERCELWRWCDEEKIK